MSRGRPQGPRAQLSASDTGQVEGRMLRALGVYWDRKTRTPLLPRGVRTHEGYRHTAECTRRTFLLPEAVWEEPKRGEGGCPDVGGNYAI